MTELRTAAERAIAAWRKHGNPSEAVDVAMAGLAAALAAEQPQPVAWTVAFNGRADIDYAYRFRDGAESAAYFLRAHKAELGPFTVAPLYAAPPPPAAEPSADERRLRRWLCAARHGHRAYMDDGEASDSSAHPTIDYLRDTLVEIDAKWQQRGRAALAAAAKG